MNGKDSMADRVIHLLHPDMIENTTHTKDLGPGPGAPTIDTEMNATKDHCLTVLTPDSGAWTSLDHGESLLCTFVNSIFKFNMFYAQFSIT